MNYGRAALISTFVVGGGQMYSGRFWTGIYFAVIFYGSIVLMINIWTELNPAFWGLVAVWILVWLFNIYDAYKGMSYEKPQCEKTCPAGIAPWIYINLVATESKQYYPFVPFFDTLERICPAPCEEHCTRQGINSSVAIKYLKSGVKKTIPSFKQKTKKEKIAIVGAGPCGLTTAYYLAYKGYEAVIYEKEKIPGGVLATLIPEFRLPKSTIDKEIENILNIGIGLKCGIEIGKDLSMDELLKKYDAVFIGTGAWKPEKLGIPGEENALIGFNILEQIKKGKNFNLGRVGVIGGGNTAIDIARSLTRQGNEVKIYYRRSIEDMPAEQENRIETQEEGIEIIPLTLPKEIKKDRVTMVKTECPEGRKGPVKMIQASEFNVALDNVVMAVGQQPETDFLKGYVKLDKFSRIITKNGKTSHPKIFAGGDVVLGSATVAHAVGHGMKTAKRIDFYLKRIPLFLGRLFSKTYQPKVKLLPINDINRITIPHRDIEERIHDFEEVELKVSKEELKREATRCLSCPLRYRP